MIDSPLVSIIIPAFNAKTTIEKTLRSVSAQSYKNIEIILIDDGSTDGTGDYAKKICANIILIKQNNKGSSFARNRGIKESRGQYIVFCDSDDELEATFIEKMVAAAQQYCNSLIICGIKLRGQEILPKYGGLIDKNIKEHVLETILNNTMLYSPCNKIYTKEIVKHCKFPNGIKYGEDLIFNLRYLMNIKSVFYIREPLYIYNLSNDGSSSKSAVNFTDRKAMYDELLKYIGKTKAIKEKILIRLIFVRWCLSVVKNKVRKIWTH